MGELRSKGRWPLINEIASYPGAALRRVVACFSSVISSIGWRLSFEKCTFLYSRRALDSTAIKGETENDIQRIFRLYKAIFVDTKFFEIWYDFLYPPHVWIIRNKTVWIFIDTSSGQKCQSKVQPLSRVYPLLHGFYGYLFILHIINLSCT